MRDQQDLGAIARGVVDANRYLTLGTMDGDGRPWLSPLFFAAKDSTAFYWVSSLAARHSQNLTRHPQVSMVIFDSQVPPYTGQAVYLSARAEQLEGSELDRGLEVFPGPAERGGRAVRLDELQPPSPYRLYRALAPSSGSCAPIPPEGPPGCAPPTDKPSTTASWCPCRRRSSPARHASGGETKGRDHGQDDHGRGGVPGRVHCRQQRRGRAAV